MATRRAGSISVEVARAIAVSKSKKEFKLSYSLMQLVFIACDKWPDRVQARQSASSRISDNHLPVLSLARPNPLDHLEGCRIVRKKVAEYELFEIEGSEK